MEKMPKVDKKDNLNIVQKFAGAITNLFKNKVTRYNTLGSSFRYMSNVASDYYQPLFFLSVYP